MGYVDIYAKIIIIKIEMEFSIDMWIFMPIMVCDFL